MRVVAPEGTWATDYFRPSLVHLRETCDGQPRKLQTDYGTVGVAVCRGWLLDDVVDPDSDVTQRCPSCVAVDRQLGGAPC